MVGKRTTVDNHFKHLRDQPAQADLGEEVVEARVLGVKTGKGHYIMEYSMAHWRRSYARFVLTRLGSVIARTEDNIPSAA